MEKVGSEHNRDIMKYTDMQCFQNVDSSKSTISRRGTLTGRPVSLTADVTTGINGNPAFNNNSSQNGLIPWKKNPERRLSATRSPDRRPPLLRTVKTASCGLTVRDVWRNIPARIQPLRNTYHGTYLRREGQTPLYD